MREPSLRPERSASANSATPAFFLRTEFYRKDRFCQPERKIMDTRRLSETYAPAPTPRVLPADPTPRVAQEATAGDQEQIEI